MRTKKSIKNCILQLYLWAVMVMFLTIGLHTQVFADTPTAGVIKCSANDTVNSRQEPSTSSAILNRLANGKNITILDSVTGADGYVWYKASYILIANGQTRTGYIRSDYVTVTQTSAGAGNESNTGDDSNAGNGSNTENTGGNNSTTTPASGTGTITANDVYVRNAAGTSETYRLVSLFKGDQVTIIGETTVSGSVWYNVTCTKDGSTYTGWTIGIYIMLNQPANPTETDPSTELPAVSPTAGLNANEFANYLRGQGFPESYITSLVQLHSKYPNWIFEPVETGVDWGTAVNSESVNGRNLVVTSSDDSMKSTASGAYDWSTNKWTVFDGSSWVAANPLYIAYCMDPRNFLDETEIFMFENLSYDASQKVAGVKSILSGSFMAGNAVEKDGTTFSYAQAFADTGASAGVSPYHLASRVLQEQGTKGTSAMISGTYSAYPGYYNYYNYGAYGSGTAAVLQSGLLYAKNQGWDTRYKSLSGGAVLLGKNYIQKGQNTLYFEKFNVVYKEKLYTHQYMANVTAAISEAKKVAAGYTDKSQVYVFRIPIYNNMPESAATFTATGNPNNYLSNISVSGQSLTPTFSCERTSYSLVVDNEVSKISVTATPVSNKSQVSGTGIISLSEGTNTVQINCKAANGSVRTYTLTVVRSAVETPSEPENPSDSDNPGDSQTPSEPQNPGQTETPNSPQTPTQPVTVTSDKCRIAGTTVTGIAPGSSANDIAASVSAGGLRVSVLNAAGNVNTGVIATGNKVVVYAANGAVVYSYDVVVYGDINGDGAINALDMIKLNRHIIGLGRLSGAYLEAADANRDGRGVDVLDMIKLNKTVLGQTTITQ